MRVYAVAGYGATLGALASGVVLLRKGEQAKLVRLLGGACLVILGIAAAVMLTTLLAFPPQ